MANMHGASRMVDYGVECRNPFGATRPGVVLLCVSRDLHQFELLIWLSAHKMNSVSGVAGLAALVGALGGGSEAKNVLALGPDSRVLLFGTEGATDPLIYEQLRGP
jgi:hypothetical protein